MAHVRLPVPVYDAYCRQANATGQSLNAVLRRALMAKAPAAGFSESNK